MKPQWFKRSDWPQEHEIKMRADLMQAVASIPLGERLTAEDVEGKALLIFSTAHFGRDAELPRNRLASRTTTDREIEKIKELCGRLAGHIETIHRPAVSALMNQGLMIFSLLDQLRMAEEIAGHAFGYSDALDESTGRPRKIEAAEVTECTGEIFEFISGKRPTFTTDPLTGEVHGIWPNVLKDVFKALWIEASVAAQVRALSKKTRPE